MATSLTQKRSIATFARRAALVAAGIAVVAALIYAFLPPVVLVDLAHVKKGTLQVGADADISIFDPKHEWTIDRQAFLSKSQNSPFHGWSMTGKPAFTIVAGKVIYRSAHLKGKS
ncbi:MAG: hypothetical protein EBZ49_11455 [Proteobacteria bacterium]|nr:hypothetical protein [Pseudomonadota bacterium]